MHLSFTIELFSFLFLITVGHVQGQLNQCLGPVGCSLDECCFNIVPRTAPTCIKMYNCFPKNNFDVECCLNARLVGTTYGSIYGYALFLDDLYGYRDDGFKYLNLFLGIPYAKPPTRGNNLRFRPPIKPDYISKWDATFYRPSCPQPVKYLRGISGLAGTIDEDCLYMNVFVMNSTKATYQRYPIMVFFQGDGHISGNTARFPGHILAQQNIMVITVQYRLNAFGFLSFEDKITPGNYGLLDQIMALQYIRNEMIKFNGDIQKVTLVGHGSAAGDVALHTISHLSGMRDPKLFHRAILMSGSDLSDFGFVKKRGESLRYAKELVYKLGCALTTNEFMLTCLTERSANEIGERADQVQVHEAGWRAEPWSPNIDGTFITDFPINLLRAGAFARIPIIGGLTQDDGSEYAKNSSAIYKGYLTPADLLSVLRDFVDYAYALDPASVVQSLQFEYSWWTDLDNNTMRLQMLRDLYTDKCYGNGLEETLKIHADVLPQQNITQMYVFNYRSSADPQTKYLGAYHGSELQYLFGFPYFLNSSWNDLYLDAPNFTYTILDRNMSDYMMYMFSNFVISGNATPEVIRNMTWDTFRKNNRTYVILDLDGKINGTFDLKQNYRMYHFAYWRNFFYKSLLYPPKLATVAPTPLYLEQYKISSFSLGGILLLFLMIIVALIIVFCRKGKNLTRTVY